MVVLLALAPTNAYVHCWPRARAHHRAFISGQIFPSDFGELQAESEGGDDLMQIAVRKEDEVRALLRARRLGIDIKLEWKQSVLDDSETPFWWREVDGEMEVVLTDHRRPTYLPATSRAHVGARATCGYPVSRAT